MTEQEQNIYKLGYKHGRDDALELMSTVIEYAEEHPGVREKLDDPATQDRVLKAVEKQLRAKRAERKKC